MQPQLSPSRGYLLDMDGTLVSGDALLPGARELLLKLAGRFAIVSNDSEHTPEQLTRRFRRWGIAVPADRILLAGTSAIERIKADNWGDRVMLAGSRTLANYVLALDLVLDAVTPDVVLVARDRRFSYKTLTAAASAVRKGARLVIACPDTSHPGPGGNLVPEAAALGRAISAVSGIEPHNVLGKPDAHLFEAACKRLGLPATDCTVIGDNPETDGKGALNIGAPFVCVQRGGLEEVMSWL